MEFNPQGDGMQGFGLSSLGISKTKNEQGESIMSMQIDSFYLF
jgi:hypothetical protein